MSGTYILLEEADSTRLIKKVNALLVAGWKLQGGIAFNAVNALYLQAMVISEDDIDKLNVSTSNNSTISSNH